jgi:hypothetical protein
MFSPKEFLSFYFPISPVMIGLCSFILFLSHIQLLIKSSLVLKTVASVEGKEGKVQVTLGRDIGMEVSC